MKILITGNKSYIGSRLIKWLSQWSNKYSVETLSLRSNEWMKKDFSKYDSILHVAAIVHHKEKKGSKEIYFKTNKELAVKIAKKAKMAGVKQFIFMSSMAVYGLEGEINKDITITKDTVCRPNTYYGQSKLEAEIELTKIVDDSFNVAIIRAPMIYGPDCPGNYIRLKKIIMKIPIFPKVENKRSMLFVDNLSEFIRLLIDNNDKGLFYPQNKNYVNTSELVGLIAKSNNKNIYYSRALAFLVEKLGDHMKVINKIFGNLTYEKDMSNYRDTEYCVVDTELSIEICEGLRTGR